jgi:hypothetical protein
VVHRGAAYDGKQWTVWSVALDKDEEETGRYVVMMYDNYDSAREVADVLNANKEFE